VSWASRPTHRNPTDQARATPGVAGEGVGPSPWSGLLLTAAVGLPREGADLPDIARQALAAALPQWHTTEPVNEIVYGTRAFDTFGETFLLLAAVVSVMMLTRHREPRHGYFGEEEAGREEQACDDPATPAGAEQQAARAAEESDEAGDLLLPDDEPVGNPAPERAQAMTLPVRLAVRIVLPMLSVAGFYLVLAGSFGANWLPLAPEQTIRSGGTVQAFSVAEFFEVGTGLTIVVFAIMAMSHDWSPDAGRNGGRSGRADNGRRR
jgi:hypothetical protein